MPARDQTAPFEKTMPEPISMRVNDACRYTGISRSTLYLLICSGDVEIIKIGATTLVLTESLKRFVAARRHPAQQRLPSHPAA